MMPRPALLSPLALLLAVSGACSPSAGMNATDDMSSGDIASGGKLEGECSSCFDTACGWQQTECAGDPACAQWLTSVRSCQPDSSGHPSADCMRSALPNDPTGRGYATGLMDCLARAPWCCTGANMVPGGGAGGQGGGSYDGTGGPPETGVDGGAGNGPDATSVCTDCDCKQCLLAVKEGAANDPSCAGALVTCYASGDNAPGCWAFAVSYAACSLASNVPSPAACYENLYTSPDQAAGLASFTSIVLPCAAQYCATHCFPAAESACVSCQVASCLDALNAFLAEPDAQLFRWCRRACEGDTSCVQGCAAEHPNGLQVFQLLAQCTAASCDTACAGL